MSLVNDATALSRALFKVGLETLPGFNGVVVLEKNDNDVRAERADCRPTEANERASLFDDSIHVFCWPRGRQEKQELGHVTHHPP